MTNHYLLESVRLDKAYRSKNRVVHPLKNVSLHLQESEILGVVGESGCGKSTLLRILCGLEKPDSGDLLYQGKSYMHTDLSEIGRHIQMIFQDAYRSFDPRKRLSFSIREGRHYDEEKIENLLRAVSLAPELLDRRPADLSGGQCQRMSIVRALYQGASVLLCDEITSALDVTTQAQIVELLLQLKAEEGLSMVFVTHDIALVSMICDRVLVLKDGEAVEQGKTQQIIKNPQHPYTRTLIQNIISI